MPGDAGRLTADARAWLLCPPRHYAIRYEINPWMDVGRPVDPGRAVAQWQALKALLEGLGARVRLLPPAAGVPDLVFTANAGLVAGRAVVLSRFRHAERRLEERIDARWFRAHGYRVGRLPRGVTFEGEGDMLRQGATWYLGYGFRTAAPAAAPLARRLKARVMPLKLVDHRFYHLDTCFAPLDGKTALWYPGAFSPEARLTVQALVPDPVVVSEADAIRFVCNAIPVGRAVVAHAGASSALVRAVERRKFTWRETDLSEFLKAGGAAKCLALRLEGGGAE